VSVVIFRCLNAFEAFCKSEARKGARKGQKFKSGSVEMFAGMAGEMLVAMGKHDPIWAQINTKCKNSYSVL
jgi:hypothetical protein